MTEFEYTIRDPYGIHARPAGLLVQRAAAFQSEISITRGGETIPARDIFKLMGLCVKQGDLLRIRADGPDEAAAAADIRDFLTTHL